MALTLAWLLSLASLYGALVGLELYWNFFDWRPKTDAPAAALGFWILAMLAAVWLLSQANRSRLTQSVSLLLCLALLALAIYVFPPELRTPGFLGRDSASPLWYRGGRAAVLSLPLVFWLVGWTRIRRRQVRTHASPGGGHAALSGQSKLTGASRHQ